jgi:acrylyl-CoA reductase (NADPH)
LIPRGFDAYRLFEGTDGQPPVGRRVETSIDELSPGDVIVRVEYCALNHKAALAYAGRHRLIRAFPRIGGAEFIGTVEASSDPRFAPGDRVQNGGHSVGIDHDGGFARFARLRADWLVRLPAGVDPLEAAAIGGNGLCAAVAIERMEREGLEPGSGPVLVTGATGGVSMLAIEMLARLGYTVHALTGKPDREPVLRAIGASEVIDAAEVGTDGRPLESGRWAGAIDSVGGDTLAWLIRRMLPGGAIAAIGNVGGPALHTTVLPFILRGVSLIGIAGYPLAQRDRLWARILGEMRPTRLGDYTQVIDLDALPGMLDAMLARRTHGRILLDPWR